MRVDFTVWEKQKNNAGLLRHSIHVLCMYYTAGWQYTAALLHAISGSILRGGSMMQLQCQGCPKLKCRWQIWILWWQMLNV